MKVTNEVLVERIDNFHREFTRFVDTDFKEVRDQVKKTNGRVDVLERTKDRLEGVYQGGVKTASFSWSVISAIFSGIATVVSIYIAISS